MHDLAFGELYLQSTLAAFIVLQRSKHSIHLFDLYIVCKRHYNVKQSKSYMWSNYNTSCAKSWLVSNTFCKSEVSTLSFLVTHKFTHLSWLGSSRRGDPVKGLRHTPCPANGLGPEADNGIMNPLQPRVTFFGLKCEEVQRQWLCTPSHAQKMVMVHPPSSFWHPLILYIPSDLHE